MLPIVPSPQGTQFLYNMDAKSLLYQHNQIIQHIIISRATAESDYVA